MASQWTTAPNKATVELIKKNLRGLATPINGTPQPEPDRKEVLRWVARSATVIGEMFEGMGKRKQKSNNRAAALLAKSGRMLWAMVEAAIPGSIARAFANYWFALLLILELVVLVGGVLFGDKGVQAVGIKLLVLTLAVWTVVQIGYLFLQRARVVAVAGVTAAILLLVPLSIGVVDIAHNGLSVLSDDAHSAAVDGVRWVEAKFGRRPVAAPNPCPAPTNDVTRNNSPGDRSHDR